LLRPARPEELELAFALKRDAMEAYVTAKWGWDEAFRREHHRQRWAQKPWHIIEIDNVRTCMPTVGHIPDCTFPSKT
jgi:hypothetical protein